MNFSLCGRSNAIGWLVQPTRETIAVSLSLSLSPLLPDGRASKALLNGSQHSHYEGNAAHRRQSNSFPKIQGCRYPRFSLVA